MDAKDLVQRGADAWNSRDQEGFFATYADGCEVTAPGFIGKGQQGLTDFWNTWHIGFSDNQVTLRLVFAEGANVVEESVFSGTNDGPLTGPDGSQIPATGRQVSVAFSGLHTAHDGRIISTRFYFDQLDILTQLGLMPGD
jgi:predicted ester cyclase